MNFGRYQWVADSVRSNDGHPRMVFEALKEFGVHETAGAADTAEIIAWVKEAGVSAIYHHDVEPWCGLFMSVVAIRAGYSPPKMPLWAVNWRLFGQPSPQASFGDVLVFQRRDPAGHILGGHVALYVGADAEAFHCLGGNQSDQVGIVRVLKSRLLTVRRPPYKTLPANVKPVSLSIAGAAKPSSNEA